LGLQNPGVLPGFKIFYEVQLWRSYLIKTMEKKNSRHCPDRASDNKKDLKAAGVLYRLLRCKQKEKPGESYSK
jgi:hypothetical protein